MRVVLQRVSRAQVTVQAQLVGAIATGVVLLVGVDKGDTLRDVEAMAQKIVGLRIFPGRTPMDLDLVQVGGACLVISQFTLAGRVDKGRRPSFDAAEKPELAAPLYERLADRLQELGLQVARGVFGAHMMIDLVNDGPVTLILTAHDGAVIHR